MRCIKFRVEGELSPKKDGAQSMWGKATEARRLVALRTGALQALDGQPPFERNISLALTVHVGLTNNRQSGDLDNYVTGVCDGLMAADTRSKLDPLLQSPDMDEIHPSRSIAIRDDAQVLSIRADKRYGEGGDVWYEVVLEGE